MAAPATIAITSASGRSRISVVLPTSTSTATPTGASYETRSDQVWMAFRQTAAEQFVDEVSSPTSTGFRHFLSPDAYTQKFGPGAAQITAVEGWLKRQGYTQIEASGNHDYVAAIPPASDRRPLAVPAQLRADVIGITGPNGMKIGLTTAGAAPADAPTSAASPDCSHYWGQHTVAISPAYEGITEAATSICGYSPAQIRDAYGLTAADTGRGTTIALIQLGAPLNMFASLTKWAAVNGLPAPSQARYREEAVGGGATNPKCVNGGEGEASLDSESAYVMAPDATQLMVEGDDCDTTQRSAQALFDAMLAPLTGHGSRPSANIESVSYTLGAEHDAAAGIRAVGHAIALRAGAEGVSLFMSSGDVPGVETPDSDPDITSVGGTTLALGPQGQRLFETGWSSAFGERAGTTGPWSMGGVSNGGGGGISSVYAEPPYQTGVVPSSIDPSAMRALPDVSATADTGIVTGQVTIAKNGRRSYSQSAGAGTSQATPLVAGIVADAEQGQSQGFGFLNPLLYSLAGTAAFNDVLPLSVAAPDDDRAVYRQGTVEFNHKYSRGYLIALTDVQNGSGTKQVTAPGYDTTGGLGSPNASTLIGNLRSAKTPR